MDLVVDSMRRIGSCFNYSCPFVMMLAYIYIGQSKSELTTQKWDSCSDECPAGSYAVSDCPNKVQGKYICKICATSTFTDINNRARNCERCQECHDTAIETSPCTASSDTKCKCKEGYYEDLRGPSDNQVSCQKCDCTEPVERPDCRKTCLKAATTPALSSTSNNISGPSMNPVLPNLNQTSWVLLVLVPVTFLLLVWLLLLFARSLIRYPHRCLCWGVNKNPQPPLEDPDFSEQSGPSDRHPNALTLNISENTPMMTLSHSPSVPEHPVHISPLDCEHKGLGEQSDRWPAIVLYAIIREVPLRRWKEFLRLLSLTDQQLERVELEAGLALGSMERQYQMLRLWSQCSTATLNDVFSALHYMDLSGCAQQLRENLEKQQFAGPK